VDASVGSFGIELWSSVPKLAVSRMSRIECRVSQNMFRRGQRLMIIELENTMKPMTTYREHDYRVTGTCMLLDIGPESVKD